MDYDKRKTKEQASREKLAEVVKAGEALGFWRTVSTQQADDGDTWRWVDVETPAGHLFGLRGGSWGREGAITASLTSIKGEHGQSIGPGDVYVTREDRRHKVEAPSASASHERPAEVIAKDLNRRVMTHADSVLIGDEMRAQLRRRVDGWKALREATAKVAKLGYEVRVGDTETYKATAHQAGFPTLEIYATGRVTVEGSCRIDDLPRLLEVMGARSDY